MSPCNEYGTEEDVRAIRASEDLGKKSQGDWGEMIGATLAVAEDKLDLIAEDYNPRDKGIDAVYRDRGRNLVLVEVKLTEAGIGSLRPTKYGRQGSVQAVERQAQKMAKDPDYPHNVRIGQEILSKGTENIRTITITVNPGTGVAKAYERQANGRWVEIGRWETREEGERLE
jgi:hypothetical protein